jgi:type I restriction enzyme R subunit
MPSQTNEQALEALIEKNLTGISKEELQQLPQTNGTVEEQQVLYRNREGNGFYMGSPNDFDAKYAIDRQRFWNFLEATQAEELDKLKRSPDWRAKVLERLDRLVRKFGVLRVLRKGLEVDDAHLTLFYQLPLASSSEAVHARFNSNQFSVTRQVRYSQSNPLEEIDMVVFVNGLPLATMELKNPWTGQNARVHGQSQYRHKRDIGQPLLNFARCIVHFTLDTDEVYMTTKLNGKDTFFLPFNKGCDNGKGNPVNEHGHKSEYFWKEILTRETLATIIQHFVRLDGKDTDSLHSRTLFFPRYHQLDVVRRLVDHAGSNGVGQFYLVQHSAGSGKSNSITWAAFRLIEVYPNNANVRGYRGEGVPLFDSVVVVTDRRLLDKQLRDNIKEFSEVKNVVAPAFNSAELKKNLESGKKIIVTTIQKFPFIVDGISDLSNKNFAVIIDEAHSSQSGIAAGKLNEAIGHAEGEDPDDVDVQDKVLEALRKRKMCPNASYLAFTATPKNSTLERFGTEQEDGSKKPFHLYSMKQAIEEGFILDVLANYTTYRSYYEIQKSVEDNPLFDSAKAQKKLKAFVERNEQTIAIKASVMLDHFITKVVNTKKLKGKAKAMVATQSIESAIRYYFALQKLLEEKGTPFKILIAFSGKKVVKGIEHTEDSINGFAEKDTRDKFDTDEYRMLVVANKYLTGFDQQKLSAMYVDKKLQGVLAVQALSRLNRACDKLSKKTEDLFILDFFNTTEDIKDAFDPFYTSTTLSGATDVNVLHDLKGMLDSVGVYEDAEIERFVEQYFNGAKAEMLSPIIDTAAKRFNTELELEDKDKVDFKIKAKQFVKIYGQVASILPFEIVEWEKLFWFLKFLIPKLVIVDPNHDKLDELLNSVDLSTYGLERVKLNETVALDEVETQLKPQNANPRGAHGAEDDRDPLDLIIELFNDRWFKGWNVTPEEKRVKYFSIAEKIRQHPDFVEQFERNHDDLTRRIAFNKIFEETFAKQRRNDLELYRLMNSDEAAKLAMQEMLIKFLTLPERYSVSR